MNTDGSFRHIETRHKLFVSLLHVMLLAVPNDLMQLLMFLSFNVSFFTREQFLLSRSRGRHVCTTCVRHLLCILEMFLTEP